MARAVSVAAVLLLTATPAAPQASGSDEDVDWRRDLTHLAEQIELRHPDLYHTLPRSHFRSALDAIGDSLPALSDDEVVLRLARLLARVGDGHTLVPLWDDSLGYGSLPLELIRTAGGLAVLAADSSLGHLAGARVLRIGSFDAAAALDSVASLVSKDNAWTAYAGAAEYSRVPRILHGLGIGLHPDRVTLGVQSPDGSRREVTVAAVDPSASIRWSYGAYGDGAPWLARRNDPYWMTRLPGDSVIYVQFNRADRDKEEESLSAFATRLLASVRGGGVRRVVVDLRWNRGGSRWRARHLLGALIAVEHALGSPRSSRSRQPSGHLVTLIGPRTFSAATQFALDLELHTNTAFVGLPTGGRPNGFGEVGRFRLPASGLEIRHSVYYHQATHARDTRPAIFPDRRVTMTTEDLEAGRDPALEAAIAWRPLPSALDELTDRLRGDQTAAALAWLEAATAGANPRMGIREAELNGLGYDLLAADRLQAAEAVFRWNLHRHPWSANAHDSLADALLGLGREREANALLCRAFAIDRQFTRALERGLRCPADPGV